jgi:hypothetical protein
LIKLLSKFKIIKFKNSKLTINKALSIKKHIDTNPIQFYFSKCYNFVIFSKGKFKLNFFKLLVVFFLSVNFCFFNVSASNIPSNWSMTYYETKKKQTDSSPCIGARNINLCKLGKQYPKLTIAAVSRDYYWKLWNKNTLFDVFCPNNIVYKNILIVDKMNKRFSKKIDILDNDIKKKFAFNNTECKIKKSTNIPYKTIYVPRIHWRTKRPTRSLKIRLKN